MRLPACAVALLGAWLSISPLSAPADLGGDAGAGKSKAAATCAACHGADGNGGVDPAWPKLAGQLPEYLLGQLRRFKAGARDNPIMKGMASALSEQDMKDLAAFYASQPVKIGVATNQELALRGQRVYRGGIAETGVPACMSCHGPSGRGIPPNFPRLYSQKAAYAEKQLFDFKGGYRVSVDNIMPQIAGRMTDADIKAVSAYLAGLH